MNKMDADCDYNTFFDSDEFKAYVSKITDIVSVLRRWPDGRIKGHSVPEIHKILGDEANPRWTHAALFWITGLQEDVGSIIRYWIEEEICDKVETGLTVAVDTRSE